MTLPLPETVRESWGENAASAFMEWWLAVMAEATVNRTDFVRLEGRLATVESDVADIKGDLRALRSEMTDRFDAVNERFLSQQTNFDSRFDRQQTNFDSRFDSLQANIDARFDGLQTNFDARFDGFQSEMNDRLTTQMRWSVGLLALFGSAVTVLLVLGQYGP